MIINHIYILFLSLLFLSLLFLLLHNLTFSCPSSQHGDPTADCITYEIKVNAYKNNDNNNNNNNNDNNNNNNNNNNNQGTQPSTQFC